LIIMGHQPKVNAALAALKFVKRGMTLGLGTGTTAGFFIDSLAKRNQEEDLRLTCIPTSVSSERRASSAGLRTVGFQQASRIDLAVDGADVVSKDLHLLKGMGGALAREKFVAYRARKFVVIVDESKLRTNLDGIVAIETVPFASPAVLRDVSKISKTASLRMRADSKPFLTDNGNHIIDARMALKYPERTERDLNSIPGVVESGIFTRADVVLVGTETGCRVLRSKRVYSYSPFSRRE